MFKGTVWKLHLYFCLRHQTVITIRAQGSDVRDTVLHCGVFLHGVGTK